MCCSGRLSLTGQSRPPGLSENGGGRTSTPTRDLFAAADLQDDTAASKGSQDDDAMSGIEETGRMVTGVTHISPLLLTGVKIVNRNLAKSASAIFSPLIITRGFSDCVVGSMVGPTCHSFVNCYSLESNNLS